MKVSDLISLLSELSQDAEVMILDGFNGGGFPREINMFGDREIAAEDVEECCDCEGKVGQTVILLGYGSY